jgi:hypothetical protein
MDDGGDAPIVSRGETGRRSTVLTRASGASALRAAVAVFGDGERGAMAGGAAGKVRRMLGCLRAVSGFGNGRGRAAVDDADVRVLGCGGRAWVGGGDGQSQAG